MTFALPGVLTIKAKTVALLRHQSGPRGNDSGLGVSKHKVRGKGKIKEEKQKHTSHH